ncbi:MAG TPA: lipopolysaccharide kinase InaA family protein, partial [Verrucomicrobiae bacterium]|nr:lipopolysaccharide kinase InaA family protein [Verrucomicrobiae bacterium]
FPVGLGLHRRAMLQELSMLSASKLVVAPDWQAALSARQLGRFDALWNLSGEVVKRANSTEVVRVALEGHTIFVKKYWVTGLNQLLSAVTRGALLGRTKVRCEFENMQQLRAWNLDAPAPVAYGERRLLGWLRRSLLVTEGIVDPMPLDAFISDTLPKRPELRRELLEKLADYVHRLHAHRFEHHDLYWRNIILSGGAPTHFYLLDAHKGSVWQPAREREARGHDLGTLDAPAPAFFRRTERLRFLLRYLHKSRLDDEAKAIAWLALASAEPIRKRQIKRVREARR